MPHDNGYNRNVISPKELPWSSFVLLFKASRQPFLKEILAFLVFAREHIQKRSTTDKNKLNRLILYVCRYLKNKKKTQIPIHG